MAYAVSERRVPAAAGKAPRPVYYKTEDCKMKKIIADYPAVGIRPIIDARMNGVREGLECQVMTMAKNVAALISKSLKYPDGSPVKCVIADSTIGRVAEAAACEKKFLENNVGVSISVTPCWCYGTETIDMHPTRPKAIFGLHEAERPGAATSPPLSPGQQKGCPRFDLRARRAGRDGIGITQMWRRNHPLYARRTRCSHYEGRSYLSIGNGRWASPLRR